MSAEDLRGTTDKLQTGQLLDDAVEDTGINQIRTEAVRRQIRILNEGEIIRITFTNDSKGEKPDMYRFQGDESHFSRFYAKPVNGNGSIPKRIKYDEVATLSRYIEDRLV